MKLLINYYHYGEIINLTRESESYKELEKLSNDYTNINNFINQIPENIKNDINNKEKKFNINELKSLENNLKIENNEIDYYDEFILINEQIRNNLNNISEIKDKFSIEVKCFIDLNNRIFLFYELKNRNIISVGKLNENNIFETNLVLNLVEAYYYQYYLNQITIKNEIPSFFDRLKQDKKRIKVLKSKNKNIIIGYAFLLDNMKN